MIEDYKTEEEKKCKAKSELFAAKLLRGHYKKSVHPPEQVKIDGVVYNSPGQAATKLGISVKALKEYLKKLSKSQRSEMGIDLMVRKTFTIQKIK